MSLHRRPRPRDGIFEAPFWAYVQDGELRVQRCRACAALRYPPAAVCPECLAAEHEWVPLSGRGTVISWTVFHRAYFPELPVPYTVLSVLTEEGLMLIGNLVHADGRSPRGGLAVQAVFEDVADDAGPWRIFQWEPVEGSTTDDNRTTEP
jgi:uncharacterized OB-fold protein